MGPGRKPRRHVFSRCGSMGLIRKTFVPRDLNFHIFGDLHIAVKTAENFNLIS